MENVTVLLDDSTFYKTNINASTIEIKTYFLGNTFNYGTAGDSMKKCIGILIGGWDAYYLPSVTKREIVKFRIDQWQPNTKFYKLNECKEALKKRYKDINEIVVPLQAVADWCPISELEKFEREFIEANKKNINLAGITYGNEMYYSRNGVAQDILFNGGVIGALITTGGTILEPQKEIYQTLVKESQVKGSINTYISEDKGYVFAYENSLKKFIKMYNTLNG